MKVQDDGRGMKQISIGKRQKSRRLSHRPEISSFDGTKSVIFFCKCDSSRLTGELTFLTTKVPKVNKIKKSSIPSPSSHLLAISEIVPSDGIHTKTSWSKVLNWSHSTRPISSIVVLLRSREVVGTRIPKGLLSSAIVDGCDFKREA